MVRAQEGSPAYHALPRGVVWTRGRKPEERVAVFECLDRPGEREEVGYSMIHVTPPMSAPDFVKRSALVNAAGWICSAPLYNLLGRPAGRHDLAVWEKTLRSNLTTALVMGSCVVEQMIRQRTRGVIINISSVAARGNAGQSAYAAAKAGCNALAMTWAKELGGFGIRALAIAPGFIDTPSTHSAMSEERLKDWVGKTALRRLGTPPEVARTVIFAVENDYLTGTVIELDGGLKL